MAGSSVSSVEGTRADSYEGEDVQAAALQPAEMGIAAAEAIQIWDYPLDRIKADVRFASFWHQMPLSCSASDLWLDVSTLSCQNMSQV